MALKLAGQNATQAVSFGTEAGLFEEAGFPTVICGPGDIAQAHQPNEFIALEQIDACERFFRRLMDEICN
jgi:acetylornithine deacetylase